MAQAEAMYTIAATALSVAVIATFALVAGGIYLLVKRKERKQGVLMLIAAVVLFGNVLVWTL
jgi:high-affinity Fe2+/Pb2+ permease